MQARDMAADLAPDKNDAPKAGRAPPAARRARVKQAGREHVAVWVAQGLHPEMHGLAAALRRAAGKLLPSETALDDGALEADEPPRAPARRSKGRQALPAAIPQC